MTSPTSVDPARFPRHVELGAATSRIGRGFTSSWARLRQARLETSLGGTRRAARWWARSHAETSDTIATWMIGSSLTGQDSDRHPYGAAHGTEMAPIPPRATSVSDQLLSIPESQV